jgi:hypothetical protein
MTPQSRRAGLRIGLALVLVATAATGVFAQQADAGRGRQMAAELQKRFTAADSNGDGKLTRDEAKAGMPFVYKHYDEIDTGKTGAITMRDIAAFAAAQRSARKAAP